LQRVAAAAAISNLKSPERERILGLWSVRPLSMRTRVLLLITNHLQEHSIIMKGYTIMITTINALFSNLLRRKSGQRLGCLLETKMNISKESSPQTRSFYRRALPPSCTALSSEEGKALFESSLAHKGLKSFFQLIEQL
jgi:hypothetical protein